MKKALIITAAVLVAAGIILLVLNMMDIVAKLWWSQLCINAALLISIYLISRRKDSSK